MGIRSCFFKGFQVTPNPNFSLSEMAGKRAAVDVSIWIHAARLRDPKQAVYRKVEILLRSQVIPVLIFDGKSIEAKREELERRRLDIIKQTKRANELAAKGNKAAASKLSARTYTRCDTDEQAIRAWCRNNGVEYVDSPFESDAQIAYLLQIKFVDFAITEDADFIPYGCDQVLFKFFIGVPQLYELAKFQTYWGSPFNLDCFRAVCILCGCDYLPKGLPGFGIWKARTLYPGLLPDFCFEKMVKLIKKLFPTVEVPRTFKFKFDRAFNVFRYQLVFDPREKTIVPLTDYPGGTNAASFPYAGKLLEAKGMHWEPPADFQRLPLPDDPDLERSHFCKDCTGVFPTLLALNVHRQDNHPVVRPVCTVCSRSFRCHSDLVDHMLSHEPTPTMKCDQCGKVFWTKQSLKEHIRDVHLEFPCDTCGLVINGLSSLKNHKLTHTDARPFKCLTCGAGFKSPSNLRCHIYTVHDPKRFKCDICKRGFTVRSALIKHGLTHTTERPHKCPQCGKGFKSAADLRQHLNLTHSNERPHKCSVCGNGFKTGQKMRRHMRSCHPSVVQEVAPPS